MDSWYETKKPKFINLEEALAELSIVDKYYAHDNSNNANYIKMYDLAADLEDISSRLRELALATEKY